MPLQKGFLHRRIHFSEIPIDRKVSGLLVGVLFAGVFYAFLYLLRDICRMMTMSPPELFWDLSAEELNFYNFIYAGIASLFGQYVCFGVWLNRNKKAFEPSSLSWKQIFHDQRYLYWFFLAGLLKLGFTYFIFFGKAFSGAHFIFSLYPHYNYLFYLLLLVLFLNNWNSFRRLFPQQSLKWMSFSAIALTVFSLALAQLDFIDQGAIREQIRSRSIYVKYDFQLPSSSHFQSMDKKYFGINVTVVRDTAAKLPGYTIKLEDQELKLEGLKKELIAFRNSINVAERSLAYTKLFIDRRVNIAYVEELKKTLWEAGLVRVFYMVVPADAQFDKSYYQGSGIAARLPYYYPARVDQDSIIQNEFMRSAAFSRKQTIKTRLELNTTKISEKELIKLLKNQIKKRPNAVVLYRYNHSGTYEKYIRMLAATHRAVEELRAEYALKKFSKNLNNLGTEQKQEVKQAFPLLFKSLPKES